MSATASPRSELLAPYYPSLDGLRAIAILMVFAVHFYGSFFHNEVLEWGFAGVDIFFVLSGFLITGILYDTLHRRDYFRNFYLRRAVRIFPLYYGLWAAFLLATPIFNLQWTRYHLTWLAYIANFFIPGSYRGEHADIRVLNGTTHWHHPMVFLIAQLWSLCVEEQFYLVWPAVLFFIRSRRALMVICAAVILGEPFLRAMHLHGNPTAMPDFSIYANTLFRVDTLLVGAFLALWLRGSNVTAVRLRPFSWLLAIIPMTILLLVINWHGFTSLHLLWNPSVVTWGFTMMALSSAGLLLLTLDPSTTVARILRRPTLIFLGRISYGMYILHGLFQEGSLIIYNHIPHFGRSVVAPTIGIAITITAAWISFRYFESPFLALKSKLAPRPGAADDPPPFLETQHVE